MSPLPAGYGGLLPALVSIPNDLPKGGVGVWLTSGAIPVSRVIKQDWPTAPATASTTKFVSTGVAGPNTATATYDRRVSTTDWDGTSGPTGLTDYPRNVVVTVTHATAVVALSGVITGVDGWGRVITEAWSVTATGTTKTFTGAKAFARIDMITIVAATDATADTVKVGTGAVLGLQFPLIAAGAVLKEIDSGSVVTNGTFVGASSASTADKRGTYTPNGAPNATKVYTVWYISDDPTLI